MATPSSATARQATEGNALAALFAAAAASMQRQQQNNCFQQQQQQNNGFQQPQQQKSMANNQNQQSKGLQTKQIQTEHHQRRQPKQQQEQKKLQPHQPPQQPQQTKQSRPPHHPHQINSNNKQSKILLAEQFPQLQHLLNNHKSDLTTGQTKSNQESEQNQTVGTIVCANNKKTKSDDDMTDNSNKNNDSIKFRQLETWQDEEYKVGDESLYKELMDTDDANGWSADEMFKYNEKIHKVTTMFNDKTMSKNYTIPLPDNSNKTTKSKNRKRLAAKIAKEIEETSTLQGRLTPESSDDDEIYENERLQRSKIATDQNQLNNCLNRMSTPTSSLSSSNSTTSSSNPSPSESMTTQSKQLNMSSASSSRNILRKSLNDSSIDMNGSILTGKMNDRINKNFKNSEKP